MNLIFGNAALAPLLALIAAPILIHFFARARPRVYRFSSITFLDRIVRETTRVKRPKSWLLLLLRTLLVAALILMFLKPVLEHEEPLAGRFERKNVVVIVDASASMAAVEGARTRFAAASARAAEIVSGLGSGDLANVVWMRSPSRPEFPTLGVNFDGLQAALREGRVSMEAADVRGAFALAMEQLRDQEGHREIHLISDFQKTNWDGVELPPHLGVRVVAIRAAEAEAGNQALTGLHTGTARVLAGESAEVLCEVTNYSPEPSLRRVFLRAGEIAESREVRVPAWGSATVGFLCPLHQEGEAVVRATIDEDEFAADNERQAVVEVRAFLRVGLAGAAREPLRRALDAIQWIQTENVTLDEPLDELDAVFLTGWTGDGVEAVRGFLENGGVVICEPAPGCPLGAIDRLAGGTGDAGGELAMERMAEPRRLEIARPDHPVLQVFAQGEHGDPAGGIIQARLRMAADGMPEGSEALFLYDDGMPALMRLPGPGALWLWNVPLDPEHGTWSGRMEVVPFLGELLAKSRPVGRGAVLREFLPGQPIQRRMEREALVEEIRVTSEAGDYEVRSLPETGMFATTEAMGPGVYGWYFQSEPVGYSVVNFPAVESDLRLHEELALGSEATVLAGSESVASLREGTALWPWLLAVVLLCAGFEATILWRSPAT